MIVPPGRVLFGFVAFMRVSVWRIVRETAFDDAPGSNEFAQFQFREERSFSHSINWQALSVECPDCVRREIDRFFAVREPDEIKVPAIAHTTTTACV